MLEEQMAPEGAEVKSAAENKVVQLFPDLGELPDILQAFAETIEAKGVAGERKRAKLLYLAITSRLLAETSHQVSVIVKAQSSTGKSYLTDNVVEFFPEEAVNKRSSVTPKALAYADDLELKHRTLYLREANGAGKGEGAAMLRQLLSEGRLDHQTVIDGKGELLKIEGPLNVVMTTIEHELDPELETRCLSVTLDESPEQTRAVMLAQARLAEYAQDRRLDMAPWHALQEKLAAGGPYRVEVPFASDLAMVIPPFAVRVRRDFKALLGLVRAHALLHQASRERKDGRIVATLEDYAAVRELVDDLVSEGMEVTVKPEMRQTVEAVARLDRDGRGVQHKAITTELKLDRSTVTRRLQPAVAKGYLVKQEGFNGVEYYRVGDPLPDGSSALPSVARLRGVARELHGGVQQKSCWIPRVKEREKELLRGDRSESNHGGDAGA
jgi:hypothetical protein